MMSAECKPHPLGQSIASVSLLANLIVAKYCHGMPLYRLSGVLGLPHSFHTNTDTLNILHLDASASSQQDSHTRKLSAERVEHLNR